MLTTAQLSRIEMEMQGWGLTTRASRMRPRRGAELSCLLLMTIPAEVIGRAMLEQPGDDLYQNLRGLVDRVLRHRSGPGGVVIESMNTGARFALEPDLPAEAYQQLFAELAGKPRGKGMRTYDRTDQRWTVS